MQRHTALDNEQGTGENTSSTKTSDSTAENETDRVGSSTAYERSEFEEKQSTEIDPFDGVESVEFAKDEGDGTSGQEVSRTVPTNVLEGVEFVSDARNGSGDNGVVLEKSQSVLKIADTVCCNL